MKRKRIIRHILPVLLALLILSAAGVAAAHPLGNFTISRYSALTLRDAAIDVLYIVDMAEIPTFRERQTMDADGDGTVSAAEESAWVERMLPELAANLRLTVDGAPVALSPVAHALSFPPGQGDLETLRLEVTLSAALPETANEQAIVYEDGNFAGRLGWQEVVATAAGGAPVESSVPAVDLSNRLRDYPADLLQAPPAVNRAELRYAPGAVGGQTTNDRPQTTEAAAAQAAAANRFSQDEFANLLDRTLDTPGALVGALLVAVGLGAAHALTPGHGKTIVGAYLVGSRGTARHALFLGLTTTITHTAGVFALGFLVLGASAFILPEQLYPWLGVLSGLLVVFIGASIFRGHFRHWLSHRHGEAHDHGHYHFHFGKGHSHHHHDPLPAGETRTAADLPAPRPTTRLAFAPVAAGSGSAHPHGRDHDHHHPHDHGHGHGHHYTLLMSLGHGAHREDPANKESLTISNLSVSQSPNLPASDPLGWRNLLALGISGGLLPCPSALILMLSAIALRQVGLGLALIVAFSIGLAGVLTGIGLVMVYAGRLLERLPIRHTAMTTRLLPMASAAFITVAGLLITWRALGEAGVL